jgi:PAS domain S-box-containing protein
MADALREREAELEIIIDRTPFMLIRCSPDLRYRFVSAAYAEMIGRRPEELVGKSIADVIGEEGFKTVLPHINRVLSGERVEYESEVLYQGVGKRFLHGVYLPEKDEHGNVNGWIASIVDITERKRAESQRDLLVAELSHRVKNTLATVISIAHLSFSKARSAEEARPSFDDRIRALAQTHARLAEANWSGVSLAALIRDETAPYQDGAAQRQRCRAGHHLGSQMRRKSGDGDPRARDQCRQAWRAVGKRRLGSSRMGARPFTKRSSPELDRIRWTGGDHARTQRVWQDAAGTRVGFRSEREGETRVQEGGLVLPHCLPARSALDRSKRAYRRARGRVC